MKTFARVEAKPGEPDDGTVFEIVQAEDFGSVVWAKEAVSWGVIEVTPETGEPRIGDRYREGKFVGV